MFSINELVEYFETANNSFVRNNYDLFESEVSERTLCGSLSQQLRDDLRNKSFSGYFVDVEYNRNNGKVKMYLDENMHEVTINCDLIIHSRGLNISKDNLIAIEMKKSHRPRKEKDEDRKRLIALTKESYDNIWSADGIALPEYVCGYSLGIYYEINFTSKQILLEYYSNGNKIDEKRIMLTTAST